MSTLKVAAINNPSASSGGISISTSGNPSGTGLDLITTQTFSAVSAVNINNCFSSAYDNYRVFVSGVFASADTNWNMRFRASGADDSTANYILRGYQVTNANFVALRVSGGTSIPGTGVSTLRNGFVLDIVGPALSQNTIVWLSALDVYSSSSGSNNGGMGAHVSSTLFDGFTIYPTAGTITGGIRVYGYRN
jgi:hypothetical protein